MTPQSPTYVVLLSSGYWHVRFGPQQFVQWPKGQEPESGDVFWGSIAERAEWADAAVKAVTA